MAQVLGEPGRYVTQQAVNKRRKLWNVCAILVAIVCTVTGFVAGLFLRTDKPSLVIASLLFVFDVGVLWLIAKFGGRRLELLEKERVAMRKGAVGEAAVAANLADFPDEFCVINDLTTPFGNLDHVVVGPTGVFVIDTKNWRGVVAADGRGELLWNGQQTDKPMVQPFVGRLMGIKDQIKTLSRLDSYFQGVFAFTSARVDAKWGTTGSVHCVPDDQLFDYIVEGKTRQELNKQEIDSIARAFAALAGMDKEFKTTSKGE